MVGAGFLVALAAAAVIGFANQRGGTCTVSAVEQIVLNRRFGQLLALFEASLWVAGGLVLLAALDRLPIPPTGYAFGAATLFGGVLFGAGAFVNRACAFGTVSRIGSGDWAYLATPAGFFFGALGAGGLPAPGASTEPSILLAGPRWIAIGVAALLLARLVGQCWRLRRGGIAGLGRAWSPHLATTVIGIAFLFALVSAGSWTYTSFLGDVAEGTVASVWPRLVLGVAVLAGAIFGGWSAGQLKGVPPTWRRLTRCLVGGAIMGVGSRLIPGGNTGLVLIGLPMLRPHAWLACAGMLLAIYAAVRVTTRADAAESA